MNADHAPCAALAFSVERGAYAHLGWPCPAYCLLSGIPGDLTVLSDDADAAITASHPISSHGHAGGEGVVVHCRILERQKWSKSLVKYSATKYLTHSPKWLPNTYVGRRSGMPHVLLSISSSSQSNIKLAPMAWIRSSRSLRSSRSISS